MLKNRIFCSLVMTLNASVDREDLSLIVRKLGALF